ncbi:hypothetical protein BCR34DRAFT_115787 [Clohesyomyces aquaticus]|uniref:Uncharacterized protein n=1 Tax=Clohesyomyces aquaticus TaxID=1231657 RepID=A0A1Y1YQK5_9PLEO|nr:hypothetical protein BCR34DRAFT_115787 [Clohesyomyces aquaticus]
MLRLMSYPVCDPILRSSFSRLVYHPRFPLKNRNRHICLSKITPPDYRRVVESSVSQSMTLARISAQFWLWAIINLLVIAKGAEVDPIVVRGSHFIHKTNDTAFFLGFRYAIQELPL